MSVVKAKALVKMEVIQVGEYEFTKQDIIGHGAFAMVYKGRKRKVPNSIMRFPFYVIDFMITTLDYECFVLMFMIR